MSRIIDAIKRRYNRYIKVSIIKRRFRRINILSSEDSIRYIIDNRCSVSRYGDGELGLMYGRSIGFQKVDERLSSLLNHVLRATDAPNHIVGIPFPLKSTSKLTEKSREFWDYFVLRYSDEVLPKLSTKRVYLDTQLSRFYSIYKDKQYAKQIFDLLRQIWQNQDIVIIEGVLTRSGVGNDLYDNAKSIARILGPAENAISMYDKMLETIKEQVSKDKLILLCYGPTATILAYDLAKLGYWAIDLGHIDIEYEWYRLGTDEKVAIQGKYTNEVVGGNEVFTPPVELYADQILMDITK